MMTHASCASRQPPAVAQRRNVALNGDQPGGKGPKRKLQPDDHRARVRGQPELQEPTPELLSAHGTVHARRSRAPISPTSARPVSARLPGSGSCASQKTEVVLEPSFEKAR